MISRPLVGYVLKAALRDRLFLALLLAVIVGASVSLFLGSAAVVEKKDFALVFAASGLRLIGAAGIVLFAVFYIRRAFESRDIDFLLSRPPGRVVFILSHAAAFSLLAVLVAALMFCALAAFAQGDAGAPFLWGLSLAVEFVIVANAALFFAMVIPSASGGAMAVFGFYALSRLMGEMIGTIHAGVDMKGGALMGAVMNVIALVIPRLDLMAQSVWLVQGTANTSAVFILAQGVACSAVLILAAIIDLVRREF
jgi:hypothetical protein